MGVGTRSSYHFTPKAVVGMLLVEADNGISGSQMLEVFRYCIQAFGISCKELQVARPFTRDYGSGDLGYQQGPLGGVGASVWCSKEDLRR